MSWASLGIIKVDIKHPRETYHSASACRILSKSDHPRQSYDLIPFLRWRPRHRNSTSAFEIYLHNKFRRDTRIHGWDITTENKCPPFWNSTSGSNIYVCATIGMSFCICLPNFVQIGPSATELWRHIHFSRWRPRYRNSTSGFGFRDFPHLRRSKSICIPNFGEISQYTVEILLLPVSENKRPPFWNSTSGSNIYVCISMGMSFCICLPNFVQIGPSATVMTSYSFSRWRPSAILNYFKVTADHPRSANGGPRSVLKFRLNRIYSFGDISILCCEVLAWNCLFTWLYPPRKRRIKG